MAKINSHRDDSIIRLLTEAQSGPVNETDDDSMNAPIFILLRIHQNATANPLPHPTSQIPTATSNPFSNADNYYNKTLYSLRDCKLF